MDPDFVSICHDKKLCDTSNTFENWYIFLSEHFFFFLNTHIP